MGKQRPNNAKSFNKALYMIIGMLLIAMVAVSAYFIMILDKTSKELSDNKYISLNSNKKIEVLAKLKDDYRSVTYEKESIEKYVPEGKEISEILKDLEQMAAKNSLSFSSYKIDSMKSATTTGSSSNSSVEDNQIRKADDYYKIPFSIELSGSFSMIGKMISEIEGHNRLLEIEKISYTQDTGGTSAQSGDIIKATFLINAYLRK